MHRPQKFPGRKQSLADSLLQEITRCVMAPWWMVKSTLEVDPWAATELLLLQSRRGQSEAASGKEGGLQLWDDLSATAPRAAGVGRGKRICHQQLNRLHEEDQIDWSRAALHRTSVPAKKGVNSEGSRETVHEAPLPWSRAGSRRGKNFPRIPRRHPHFWRRCAKPAPQCAAREAGHDRKPGKLYADKCNEHPFCPLICVCAGSAPVSGDWANTHG